MKNFTTKIIVLLVLFVSVNQISFSQYTKYVVKFNDKNDSPYQLNNPSEYLSKKAINRRTRYNIAIDSFDFPVNPSYISQVLAQGGVSYLSQSKWLNQILIYTTSKNAISAIKTLPFVKRVEAVAPTSTTFRTRCNGQSPKARSWAASVRAIDAASAPPPRASGDRASRCRPV